MFTVWIWSELLNKVIFKGFIISQNKPGFQTGKMIMLKPGKEYT